MVSRSPGPNPGVGPLQLATYIQLDTHKESLVLDNLRQRMNMVAIISLISANAVQSLENLASWLTTIFDEAALRQGMNTNIMPRLAFRYKC